MRAGTCSEHIFDDLATVATTRNSQGLLKLIWCQFADDYTCLRDTKLLVAEVI
jgi:hypothetical protein